MFISNSLFLMVKLSSPALSCRRCLVIGEGRGGTRHCNKMTKAGGSKEKTNVSVHKTTELKVLMKKYGILLSWYSFAP
jgi:hypothetical protein